jgi:outer membrane protein TolC
MFTLKLVGLALALQGGAPLSLDEALKVAEANAFPVKASESALRKTRARLSEIRGNLGPRVSLSGTYTRYDKANSFGGGSFGGGTGGGTSSGAIDSTTAGASLTWTPDILKSQGKVALGAAKSNVKASEENLKAEVADLRSDVKASYYTVLRAQSAVRVSESAVSIAEEQLRVTTLKRDVGTAAGVDVLRIEAQVQQAKSDLLTNKNQFELAKANFNNLLARPIDAEVNLVDVDSMPELSLEEKALVPVAQGNRPEIKSLEYTIDALERTTRYQAGGLGPSLNFSVNYSHNFDPGTGQRKDSGTGVAALSWPIFDNGITRAKVSQAKEDEVQAAIQLQQIKLGISLEVRQALTNFNNSKSRYTVAQRQVELSEEVVKINRLRNDAGEGIFLEVIDAQQQLTQARFSLLTAKYDYLTALAQLQRAVGTDDLAKAMEGKQN